jgi:hypothetical protein
MVDRMAMQNVKARKISAGAAVLGLLLLVVGAVTSGTRADAADDVTAPTLTEIIRTSAATLTEPGPVTLSFKAADPSGIIFVSAIYVGRGGNAIVSSPNIGTSGNLTVTALESSVGGNYALAAVRLIDGAGNDVSYLRDGAIFKQSAQTTSVPTSHSLDFKAADFTYDNDNGDTTNPVLTSITRSSPATITAPATVTLSYTAADAGVGVQSVQTYFVGPGLSTQVQIPSSVSTTASGTLSVTVPANTPKGTYSLAFVRVMDKAVPENDVTYNLDKTITKLTPGTTGPTTHTINFVPLAFTVSDGTTPSTSTSTTSTTVAGGATTTTTTVAGGSSTTSTTASGGSSTTSTTASSGATTSTTVAGGATTSTTVAGGATTSTTTPVGGVTVTPSTAAPGATVRVTSAGWKPGSAVQVLFRSDPVQLATLTADAAGAVDGKVTIPAAATAGAHTIELTGTGADGVARTAGAAITITAKSSLPKTGANTAMLTSVGVALLLAGVAGVALGEGPAPAGERRRRRR